MVLSVQRKPDPRSRGCGETPDLQRHRKPRRQLRAGGASTPASGEGGAGAGRGSQSREAQRRAGIALWPRTTGQKRTPRPAPPQPSLSAEGARVSLSPSGPTPPVTSAAPSQPPSYFPPDPQTAVSHPRGGIGGAAPARRGSPCPRVPRPPPGTRELTEATSSNAGVLAAARAPRGRKASSPPPVPLGPQLTAHRRGERRGQGSPAPGERREAAASP